VNPASHLLRDERNARLPVLRATSEARGRRAATANADTLSVEDASPVELARVVATGRGDQFSRREQAREVERPGTNAAGGSGRFNTSGEKKAAEPKTLLQSYLDRNGIPAAWVEKEGPFARETFRRWRLGQVEMRRKQMVRVLGVLQRITKKPIRIDEIFDLDPANPDNWID